MIDESHIIDSQSDIYQLKKEANELVSIFVSSVITVRKRLNQKS